MQASSLAQNVQSGTQIQMIGVTKDNLCLNLLAQFAKVYTLYATYCAHRHEDRRLNLSVVGGNQSRTGVAGCIGMLYFKLHLLFLFLFIFFGNGEIKRILYNLIGQGKIPYILHILHIVEVDTLQVHFRNLQDILLVLLTH